MAKRARGTVRPGQRRPIQRRPASSGAPVRPADAGATTPATVQPRPGGLTEAEEARAAELEAQLLAEEHAAQQVERKRVEDRAREREQARSARTAVPAGSLAVRAANEYAYVARDVKRITWLSVGLTLVLIVAWILLEVVEVVPLG